MTKEERYKNVLSYFETNVGLAETELKYNNPFELLVAVILSAQCTDKRVNLTTPKLFKDYPTPVAMASTNSDVIFSYIRSISYPNNKAKHLVGMANMLVNDFNSQVPGNVDELIKLPGVGRKTANVIASVVFNKPTMAVDTHVFRVSNRIGLTTNAKNPLQCEMQLIKFIPEHQVTRAHHWLILHGRYVCLARTPKCNECGIKAYCKYFEKLNAKQIKIKSVKPNVKLISNGKKNKTKNSVKKAGKKSS
ncbi:MAG: endonuclease III [Bacteroidota bacterium]|nr:endonuclease III [Bacteroidota bacterium]